MTQASIAAKYREDSAEYQNQLLKMQEEYDNLKAQLLKIQEDDTNR